MNKRYTRKLITIICSLALLISLINPSSLVLAENHSKDSTTDSYIIGLKKNSEKDKFIEKHKLKGKKPKKLKHSDIIITDLNQDELEKLQANLDVEYIESNSLVEITATGKAKKEHRVISELKKNTESVPWGTIKLE